MDTTSKPDMLNTKANRDIITNAFRKDKRDVFIASKRLVNSSLFKEDTSVLNPFNQGSELDSYIKECNDKIFTPENISELAEKVKSEDKKSYLYGLIGIRSLLSTNDNPPIEAVLKEDVISTLMKFLIDSRDKFVQLEAARALTNLCGGTLQQTYRVLTSANMISTFINIVESGDQLDLVKQAIDFLGNIAGDTYIFRDEILRLGAMKPLIKHIEKTAGNIEFLTQGIWALSNLCRGRPIPQFEEIKDAIYVFSRVLANSTNEDVITDSIWAVSYLAEIEDVQKAEEKVEFLLKSEILTGLMICLENEFDCIILPALRAIGYLAKGSIEQVISLTRTQNLMKKVFELASSTKKAVRRESCNILANIASVNQELAADVALDQSVIDKLLHIIRTDQNEVIRVAISVFANASKFRNNDLILTLWKSELNNQILELLDSVDSATVIITLDFIRNILSQGQIEGKTVVENDYFNDMKSKGIIKRIERLIDHPSPEVSKIASKITNDYDDESNIYT